MYTVLICVQCLNSQTTCMGVGEKVHVTFKYTMFIQVVRIEYSYHKLTAPTTAPPTAPEAPPIATPTGPATKPPTVAPLAAPTPAPAPIAVPGPLVPLPPVPPPPVPLPYTESNGMFFCDFLVDSA